ncbi:hypothetical protein A2442_03595 [Candidatus Campbellbacteria bacterium RIFOXYC2_FULL_35_25]|uniref:50S ribosomal protein L35 n=1 Tax=Candidatus Campbellbacteria bacterium RIFOXYC2_FULL_35_25 TaxID=1797582 RepID=A0A1F5EJM2_9BACT|nr:MAG: hypothetical protein A2442_03595 [Candidatus Campbellbacteria bacterium RIFOXYC2_FULL_35_25]
MKTNKSFQKRIKVSKNGKLSSRKIGQGHFNAKATGSQNLKKRKMTSIVMTSKSKSRFLK